MWCGSTPLKAENGMRKPLPPGGGGLTVTETMVTVTDLLHALNVQMFELAHVAGDDRQLHRPAPAGRRTAILRSTDNSPA